MVLDQLPPDLDPIIRVIDDWVTNRRLALAFEARIGSGKLLVTSANLSQTDNPVSRQMMQSFISYMGGARFNPKAALAPEQVRGLFRSPSGMEKHGAAIKSASSAQTGYEAANAIDGNPRTMWHTVWEDPKPSFPHTFEINFDAPVSIRGFYALPRQDGNHNGWIKDYEIYLSADGQTWGQSVAKGSFPDDARQKQIDLSAPVQARYIRFVALSGHTDGPWASLAEFSIIE